MTGSKFLLESGSRKVLVDCGLFQGLKELRLLNWAPFPVDPSTLDAIALTHAHLDHVGYLPVLVKRGFQGPVLCTDPTRDLAKVILMDSAQILEYEAERANQEGYSRHSPALPLYTEKDARRALELFRPCEPDAWLPLAGGMEIRFTNSGHILGSSIVEIRAEGRVIAFSGDLGRSDPLLLHPPQPVREADVVVIESTYGDRLHPPLSPLKELATIVRETHEKGGHLIIPSFAVGRTQDVLFLLSKLKEQSQIPMVPVFLDSPMGIHATEILADHPSWHRLSAGEIARLCEVVTMVRSQQQSEELLRRRESAIVIAGSGMLSGGRVLNHLERRLPDARNTILLVGYQAASTRGALLRGGITELKIRGQYVPVRAAVREISTLSAHADQRDLLNWLGGLNRPPRQVFIVHGEPQAADALRVKLRDTLGWDSVVPGLGQNFRCT